MDFHANTAAHASAKPSPESPVIDFPVAESTALLEAFFARHRDFGSTDDVR